MSDFRGPSQTGGPGPSIYIPKNSVVQLYPKALGSLLVSSYDSLGYDGGIRTRFYMETNYKLTTHTLLLTYPRCGELRKHRFEPFLHCCVRTKFSDFSGIVACMKGCCLAMTVTLVPLFSLQASCQNINTERKWIYSRKWFWIILRILEIWRHFWGIFCFHLQKSTAAYLNYASCFAIFFLSIFLLFLDLQ